MDNGSNCECYLFADGICAHCGEKEGKPVYQTLCTGEFYKFPENSVPAKMHLSTVGRDNGFILDLTNFKIGDNGIIAGINKRRKLKDLKKRIRRMRRRK